MLDPIWEKGRKIQIFSATRLLSQPFVEASHLWVENVKRRNISQSISPDLKLYGICPQGREPFSCLINPRPEPIMILFMQRCFRSRGARPQQPSTKVQLRPNVQLMQVESRSYDRRKIFIMPLQSACFAQLGYARMVKQGWREENNTFFLLRARKHAWSTNFSIFYIYIEFSPVRLSAMARNDPSAKLSLDAYTNCRNYQIQSLGIAGLEPATFKLKAYCSTN